MRHFLSLMIVGLISFQAVAETHAARKVETGREQADEATTSQKLKGMTGLLFLNKSEGKYSISSFGSVVEVTFSEPKQKAMVDAILKTGVPFIHIDVEGAGEIVMHKSRRPHTGTFQVREIERISSHQFGTSYHFKFVPSAPRETIDAIERMFRDADPLLRVNQRYSSRGPQGETLGAWIVTSFNLAELRRRLAAIPGADRAILAIEERNR